MELTNLLQSKSWEEFEKTLGNKTFWVDDALLIKNPLPKGMSYLYCPRGPRELNSDFIKKATELAKKESAIFIRIEPLEIPNTQCSMPNLVKTINLNPANTLILDLAKSEDALLSEMKQKTRYNINLAIKKGVGIEVTTDPEKAQIFYNIMKQTSARDKFGAHSLEHYKKLLEVLGTNKIIRLYLAKYEGRYIAANIVSFFGNTVSYLHGASANEYRNVMAPYLLQWEAIKDAKVGEYEYYDFWGIAPDDSPKHRWSGVTRFKKGFGGQQFDYPGTYDIVISKKWYFLYKVLRKLNRLF
ncbi:MAG TPA: peptidoglycan bridge formation glycyltransferase FemA/FemB family protein [Patescibacteria group bacterium]|nr:peptidoglycan bridge formation glycyltransferase FemA/FemB family protein [Patescibacteria group bacterium]